LRLEGDGFDAFSRTTVSVFGSGGEVLRADDVGADETGVVAFRMRLPNDLEADLYSLEVYGPGRGLGERLGIELISVGECS
jgi:uncharacterized protein YfaS (alpha-2-macroglobulin family)